MSQPMRPPITEASLDRSPLSLLEHIAKNHQTLKGSLGGVVRLKTKKETDKKNGRSKLCRLKEIGP